MLPVGYDHLAIIKSGVLAFHFKPELLVEPRFGQFTAYPLVESSQIFEGVLGSEEARKCDSIGIYAPLN